METIKCLAVSHEFDRPWMRDERFANMILDGKIKPPQPQVSVWWLDETMQSHFASYEPEQPRPQFECVSRPGVEIEVRGFNDFTIHQTHA